MSLPASPRLCGLLLGLLPLLLGLMACGHQDPVSRGQFTAFGTKVDLTLISIDRERADEITQLLASDLQGMEAAWHAWRPGPVSRMNELFNRGREPFAAAPSVLPLLRLSKTLSERSGDLFNPAIGHLFRAWGFHGRPQDCLHPPPPDLIAQAVKSGPTMRDILIDGFRVSSSNQSAKLDFRAIERGFAVDQAIARLQELGVRHASVNLDGNVRAIGSRDGRPWSVPIRGPGGGGVLATLEIKGNEAAFTKGYGRHAFTWQGKVYHDIINPGTGYPADRTASVTVLHPTASTADAAATALFIAGPDNWHRVAKRMAIRYVMLTDRQGRLHMNPAMRARVKLQSSSREVIISEPLT